MHARVCMCVCALVCVCVCVQSRDGKLYAFRYMYNEIFLYKYLYISISVWYPPLWKCDIVRTLLRLGRGLILGPYGGTVSPGSFHTHRNSQSLEEVLSSRCLMVLYSTSLAPLLGNPGQLQPLRFTSVPWPLQTDLMIYPS